HFLHGLAIVSSPLAVTLATHSCDPLPALLRTLASACTLGFTCGLLPLVECTKAPSFRFAIHPILKALFCPFCAILAVSLSNFSIINYYGNNSAIKSFRL